MAVGNNKLDIFDTANKILAEINTVFQNYDEILPERQYVWAGEEPSHDCPQVTIGFVRHYPGRPGSPVSEPSKCNDPRTGAFRVEITRECSPNINPRPGARVVPPSVEQIEADTKRKLIDATLLMEAGMNVASLSYTAFGGTAEVTVGPVRGTFQSVIMDIDLGVE